MTVATYTGCMIHAKTPPKPAKPSLSVEKIAVITGDIVDSTALGAAKLEIAMAALEDCAKTQAEWMSESLHFTRHRGDGWQVALVEPKYALRSALAFRAALRAHGREFDSYFGIAVGTSTKPIATNLNSETAPVFVHSGHALDMLHGLEAPFIRIGFHSLGATAAAMALADLISRDWTKAQAQAVLPMLSRAAELSFTDLAEKLGKSRQAVTKALAAAKYHEIDFALQLIEDENP